jgi:MFS family permease
LPQLLASVTGEQERVGYYAGVMVRILFSHSFVLKNVQDSTRQALSLLTVLFWSRLSDHIGRKPILLLGTAALAVSMISFGLSTVFWALVLRHGSALSI